MNNRRGDGSVYSTGVMPRTHGLLPVSAADEMHVEQVIDADTQCCTWDARQHWGKYRPQRPLKRYAIRLTNLKITCSSVTNRDVVLSYAFIAATEHILHSLTSWDTLTLTVAPKLAMIGHGRVCRNPPPSKNSKIGYATDVLYASRSVEFTVHWFRVVPLVNRRRQPVTALQSAWIASISCEWTVNNDICSPADDTLRSLTGTTDVRLKSNAI